MSQLDVAAPRFAQSVSYGDCLAPQWLALLRSQSGACRVQIENWTLRHRGLRRACRACRVQIVLSGSSGKPAFARPRRGNHYASLSESEAAALPLAKQKLAHPTCDLHCAGMTVFVRDCCAGARGSISASPCPPRFLCRPCSLSPAARTDRAAVLAACFALRLSSSRATYRPAWRTVSATRRCKLKASRGFEPRSLDSESRVLTVTPRGRLQQCSSLSQLVARNARRRACASTGVPA